MKIINTIPQWKIFLTPPSINSKQYWDQRYRNGHNSGAGSYGHLGRYKADTVNQFISTARVKTVIDMGCGDGNIASMLQSTNYIGYDISETAILRCRSQFANQPGKTFTNTLPNTTFDLAISMDVIFHLVEDIVFEVYMRQLFAISHKYVIIYSSNGNKLPTSAPHVYDRNFTSWIAANQPTAKLIQQHTNPFKYNPSQPADTSISDFYVYEIF